MKKVIKKLIPQFSYQYVCKLYDYILFLINNTYLHIRKLYKKDYNILSEEITIEEIIQNKKSMARFGDGEFKWMLDIPQNSFQENDPILTKRLNEIINTTNDNIMIGIPYAFNTLRKYNYEAKKYWGDFLFKNIKKIDAILEQNKTYINTNITRPYIDYKSKTECAQRFNNLKRIWDKKEIIIIEGEKSKLGMGNDLFDNTKKIERIICPSKNAFKKYNEILKFALAQNKEKLILISLGPTATVLAYDLCVDGHQALDIGHIDIEYEWFKHSASEKTEVEGKFVNEVKNKNVSDKFDMDEIYLKSIIKKIL